MNLVIAGALIVAVLAVAWFYGRRGRARALDPQVAREPGIIVADLLAEALGFLAADERLA